MSCGERRVFSGKPNKDELPPITSLSTKPTAHREYNVFYLTTSSSQRLLLKVDDSPELPRKHIDHDHNATQPAPHSKSEKQQIVQQERPAYHTLMKLKLPQYPIKTTATKRKEALFALREMQLAALKTARTEQVSTHEK
ncbi:hypothetical protein EIN_065990 [Entamoeba invadens IP1]|uniref:Uncharacterized protein n=1 Tax=Entamoeba invadens IP1 TaxID=370355 RepID=A0A0A1TVB9_ENTIV|nr:hypothetical protein EIN_065990 [Entamoeba invadens IP1]ELP84314.1 hypothetical protein EIN_065990 [Entamoeba invadens IP1]|eukprot:XP_004183660.1 hypothetical protein EIN_065990 [Entamoeba invadens IP1]